MWWQNLDPFYYILVILLVIIIVLAVESFRHRRALRKIPYRIHVNGTRGKSSVARLIAAGLRSGGLTTCAKTTGTLARFIFPDGTEEAVYRMGHTNVGEQIKIIERAAQLKSDVLVIECMALQPLLQSLCELKLVQSTHGVLTNARPDHLDVMGPGEEDVALAMAGTMTVKGKYFTCEDKHIDIFKMAAKDRQSEIIQIGPRESELISDEAMSKFPYREFKENVALALAVCESLNVSREVALKGMWSATPDPGAMCIYEISYQDHTIIFANGFAANDPVSTEMLWKQLNIEYAGCENSIMVVNCRSDRHERSFQMGEAIVNWQAPKEILLVGNGTKTFTHACYKTNKVKAAELNIKNGVGWTVDQVLTHIVSHPSAKTHLVIGVCNIADIGLALVDYFQKKSQELKEC